MSRGRPGPYHPKVIDPADLHLRNATYRLFIHLGRAPTAGEVAVAADRTEAEVRDGWQRLHDGHALALDAAGEISMANPFAARPTPFRVEAAGRSWFANCGQDAFGIGAALHVDSTIRTMCADCREPLVITVRDGRPTDGDLGSDSPARSGVWGRAVRSATDRPVGQLLVQLSIEAPVSMEATASQFLETEP